MLPHWGALYTISPTDAEAKVLGVEQRESARDKETKRTHDF
jgi:hypothetical protein